MQSERNDRKTPAQLKSGQYNPEGFSASCNCNANSNIVRGYVKAKE